MTVPPRDDAPGRSPRPRTRTWSCPDERPSRMDASVEQTSLDFNPDAADRLGNLRRTDTIADDAVTGTTESIVLGTQEPSPVEAEDVQKEARQCGRGAQTSSSSRWPRALTRRGRISWRKPIRGCSRSSSVLPVPKRQERAPARAYLWIAGLVGLGVFLMAQNHQPLPR